MNAMTVGVVGCGAISKAYLDTMCKRLPALKVTACADLDPSRAKATADTYGLRALDVDALLADPEVDIVLNLTVPKAHAAVALRAIRAGKHVYSEKPLAVTREDGRAILDAAGQAGVRVGNAPDTFLGAGLQTCRKLIDDGAIGRPIAATAFMMGHGPESWHPNPEFFYEVGGGPMFDMGPYYLTALVHLIGPIRRVTASTAISFPERTITSAKKNGKVMNVEIPTHIGGTMEFEQGAIGTIVTSFDVWAHTHSCIEVYGTEGSMLVPDPNRFDGSVRVRCAADKEWRDVPLTHDFAEGSRGLGVADMAEAIQTGGPHRASGVLAYHVLDAMHAFHDAAAAGRHVVLESHCDQPAPRPAKG